MGQELNLRVVRDAFTEHSTIGKLYVDGVYECETLEDQARAGPKVPGATAIPCGQYEVVINFSERFKRPMPLLLNVRQFDGIRIHVGNVDANTDGCVLVGTGRAKDAITGSVQAFSLLFLRIQTALTKGKVWITIEEDHEKVTGDA